MQKYRHGQGIIVSVRSMPNGSRVVSASADGTVIMWDTQTGKSVWSVDLDEQVRVRGSATISRISDMDVSPDGSIVAVSYNRNRVVGDRVAGAGEFRIGLLNAQDGREQRVLVGHTAPINAVAFSRTEPLVASVSSDNTARIWNTSTGTQVSTISLKERSRVVAFSPDGNFVALAAESPAYLTPPQPPIELYDVQSGKLVHSYPRPKRNVSDLAFSRDGQLLAIASDDMSGAQTNIWELSGQTQIRTLTDHKSGIVAISFSSKGRWLASGELRNGRGIVVVRDLMTNGPPEIHKVDAGVSALDFLSDATRLVVGTDNGQIILIPIAIRQNQ